MHYATIARVHVSPESTSQSQFGVHLISRALRTRWLMRLPIPLFRLGLGWLFASRLLMIEHRGRTSGLRRFVVLECLDREPDGAVLVASGFGAEAQWYRNLRSNRVAYLTVGTVRRRRADPRILGEAESARHLQRYAIAHPEAWRHLKASMTQLACGKPDIRLIALKPASP